MYLDKVFKLKNLLVFMKKLVTREERKKTVKRNQIILGLILVLLMVFSTLGYALSGRDFIKDSSGYWRFNIQGFDFATQYSPEETQDIYFFLYASVSDYGGNPLYFVGDIDAGIELKRNLNYFPQRMNDACLNNDCEGDFPIKNCSKDYVISIREPLEDEDSGVSQDENCIIIVANSSEQIRYSDAVLFKLLGI